MGNEARTLSLEDLDIEDITLLPSDFFHKKSSIESAKSVLQRIIDEDYDYRYKAIDLNYENDTWIIYYEIKQNHVYLKFDDIKKYFTFTNTIVSSEIIDAIKCWSSEIMRSNSPRAAASYLSSLKRAIIATNGFSPNSLDDFIDMINDRTLTINGKEKNLGEHGLYGLMTGISNFHDYYAIPEIDAYVEAFARIRKPKIDKSFRNIPSSKDVYRFSYYLDLWRKEIANSEDKDEMIYYFPVYLWWKLTSIIPMRPSEFANLDSDCIFIENGKSYIKLPRGKEKNLKKIQIPDVLMISKELYDEIDLYKELAKTKGYSETLISYRAITSNFNYRGTWIPKINKNRTNYDVFSTLLENFHTEILSKKYGLTICEHKDESDKENTNETNLSNKTNTIQRMLRPHDSRHIAIVSLMLQGYDKIEIARLAGHANLTNQYDYYNHVRFWVDSEVKRLSEEFDLRNSYDLDNYSPTSFEANEKFESLFLNSWKNSDKEQHYKLKLGFCSDKEMRCPSGFIPEFSGCYHCNYWGIDFEELSIYSEVIKDEISVTTDNLNKCTEFLLELHQRSNMGVTGDVNTDLRNNIKTAANKVKSEIITVAKLQQINNLLQ